MTFFGFYMTCVVLAAVMLIIGSWSDLKKDPDERITLQNLFVGMLLVFFPVVNTLIVCGLIIYFVVEGSSKIVLFGKR